MIQYKLNEHWLGKVKIVNIYMRYTIQKKYIYFFNMSSRLYKDIIMIIITTIIKEIKKKKKRKNNKQTHPVDISKYVFFTFCFLRILVYWIHERPISVVAHSIH